MTRRTLLAGAALTLWISLPHACRAAELPAQDTLRVVFSPDKLSSVNRNDALAAFKAWIETVGRRRGINLLVQADTYDSVQELKEILRNRSADLFIIRSLQYLEVEKDRDRPDPVFMPERLDIIQQRYVLLVRRDRHLALADLRGKHINLLNSLGVGLSRTWMQDLLRKGGHGTWESFCPGSEDASKPSAAVLPVYFGKADACVVEASSFAVMQELNPQLGQALEACQTSPPFLESVICVRHDYFQYRAELIEALGELHREAAGRQILMVFKVDRLVPFEGRALDTVRELRSAVERTPGMVSR